MKRILTGLLFLSAVIVLGQARAESVRSGPSGYEVTPSELLTIKSERTDFHPPEHRAVYLNRIAPKDVKVIEDYAASLLEDYPPEDHVLLLLGAQNLILSAVLKNLLGDDVYQDYVRDIPVRKMVSLVYSPEPARLEAVLERLFPSPDELKGRKPVVTRVLHSGFNVTNLTQPMDSFLRNDGILPAFDYLTGQPHFYYVEEPGQDFITPDRFVNLMESQGIEIKIKNNPNYDNEPSFGNNRVLMQIYTQYEPWELYPLLKEGETLESIKTREFVPNPLFPELLETICRKMTNPARQCQKLR